jgi:LPXTG-motif cell wall-anchored protein
VPSGEENADKGINVKQLSLIVIALAALLLLLPTPVALGQQPASTTIAEKRLEAADPPGQAEVMQVVLAFAPGAWTPTHTHGGDAYVMVLEGEVSLRMGDTTQQFKMGEGWIDSRDMPHAVGNDSSAPARVVVTFVLPKGATPTTIVATGAQSDLPPGPTTIVQFKTDAPALPSPLDVIQRFIEYVPGASSAPHTHPGPNRVTVLEGELTVHEGTDDRKVGALQSFIEPAGHVHSAHNMSAGVTRVVAAALVPRGAPYSTVTAAAPAPAPAPVAAPARAPAAPAPVVSPAPVAPVQVPSRLPSTGDASLAGMIPAGLAGLILLTGGILLRRARR